MKRTTFALLVGLAVVIGAALRLYDIQSQLLIDDEWHSLNFVIGKTYRTILSTFDPYDNSSPILNVHAAWLHRTFGWSELTLRAPSLLAGIASLLVFPAGVRRLVGERAAVLFAFLVALSPFLVFYSRMARAYSPLALLGFTACLAWLEWMETGHQRYATGFVVLSLGAIGLHLSAAIAVFTFMGIAAGAALLERRGGERWPRLRIEPEIGSVLRIGAILAALTAVILVPAIAASARLPWWSSSLSWKILPGAASLLAGTASPWLTCAFLAATAVGLAALARERTLLAASIVGMALAYTVVVAVSRPKGIDHAVVVLRYAMPLVPFVLLLAACGFDRGLARLEARIGPRSRRFVPGMLVIAGFALLFLAGPLPETYATTNNFTNHSTFQGSYERHSWERSEARHIYPDRVVRASEVAAFYLAIAADPAVDTIIEYPYDICNYNNVFYFFQHFHRKRVIGGYSSDPRLVRARIRLSPDSPPGTFQVGMLPADLILARLNDPSRLAFRNMVDVGDAEKLANSGADYLVLHRSLYALAMLNEGYGHAIVTYESTPILAEFYRRSWGAPAFEDESIVVFKIPRDAHPRREEGDAAPANQPRADQR